MADETAAMRHTLRFSLRRDADELTLDEIRSLVERAIGCSLSPGGERYDMFLFEGRVLGMDVLLGEWHGLEDRRTFQIHGATPASPNADPSEFVTIRIDAVVIDLFSVLGAGQWRVPSEEEIMAEAEYGARRDERK